jgi:hypothetical protein
LEESSYIDTTSLAIACAFIGIGLGEVLFISVLGVFFNRDDSIPGITFWTGNSIVPQLIDIILYIIVALELVFVIISVRLIMVETILGEFNRILCNYHSGHLLI